MSARATAWAWQQDIRPPLAKLLLLKIADMHSTAFCFDGKTFKFDEWPDVSTSSSEIFDAVLVLKNKGHVVLYGKGFCVTAMNDVPA